MVDGRAQMADSRLSIDRSSTFLPSKFDLEPQLPPFLSLLLWRFGDLAVQISPDPRLLDNRPFGMRPSIFSLRASANRSSAFGDRPSSFEPRPSAVPNPFPPPPL